MHLPNDLLSKVGGSFAALGLVLPNTVHLPSLADISEPDFLLKQELKQQGSIADIFRRRRADGTRGPDGTCVIAPDGVVWSNQPMFIWQDEDRIIQSIEVYSEFSIDPIWPPAGNTGGGSIRHMTDGWHVATLAGLELEPNTSYYFALRQAGDTGQPPTEERIGFELISSDDQEALDSDLSSAAVNGGSPSWEAYRIFNGQNSTGKSYVSDMARILFSMPASSGRDASITEITRYCEELSQ